MKAFKSELFLLKIVSVYETWIHNQDRRAAMLFFQNWKNWFSSNYKCNNFCYLIQVMRAGTFYLLEDVYLQNIYVQINHIPIKLIPSGCAADMFMTSSPISWIWCHIGARLDQSPNLSVTYTFVPGWACRHKILKEVGFSLELYITLFHFIFPLCCFLWLCTTHLLYAFCHRNHCYVSSQYSVYNYNWPVRRNTCSYHQIYTY